MLSAPRISLYRGTSLIRNRLLLGNYTLNPKLETLQARAMAKPAGSLDADAKTTKSSIENAEAQADSAAYMAANEAVTPKPLVFSV